jgi:hypothetical protein
MPEILAPRGIAYSGTRVDVSRKHALLAVDEAQNVFAFGSVVEVIRGRAPGGIFAALRYPPPPLSFGGKFLFMKEIRRGDRCKIFIKKKLSAKYSPEKTYGRFRLFLHCFRCKHS